MYFHDEHALVCCSPVEVYYESSCHFKDIFVKKKSLTVDHCQQCAEVHDLFVFHNLKIGDPCALAYLNISYMICFEKA